MYIYSMIAKLLIPLNVGPRFHDSIKLLRPWLNETVHSITVRGGEGYMR